MSIKVQGISKLYGEQKALNKVSFEINTGKVTGFLGPNGAGKSTMMKIITGYINPNEGDVWVDGIDVQANPMEARRLIGYLPEHNPLYLEMYVKEYLSFVAGVYKLENRSKKVAEMIDRTGLDIEQNKKIGALSKGYRQRVGLAQALIHDPKILVLDEPTSGLDPNQLMGIRSLITDLGEEKTVLLSTHLMQEVEAMCDDVIILDKGEIVANQSTAQIQEMNQGDKLVVLLETLQTIPSDKLKALSFIGGVKALAQNKWLIESVDKQDIRPKLFDFAVSNNYTILTLHQQGKSMEQIFQQLTNN